MVALDTALVGQLIAAVALASARATGMLALTPFLGKGVLTGMARTAVTLALSLPVVPAIFFTRPPGGVDLWTLLALGLKEAFLGMVLALPLATVVWGMEAAGFVIDNQRGATMASTLSPATGEQSSPMGILLAQVLTAWLFASGGFLGLLGLLYASHGVWGAWDLLPAFGPEIVRGALAALDVVMYLAILFAGPAMIAMFLAEMGLALVGRFAPQLQVFFLAMPVKSAVGVLVLLLGLAFTLPEAGRRIPTPAEALSRVTGWLR